ncbi:MAG: hypothetical protein KGL04_04235 [Elusimicrobia bacterium]|nr:hypothetical protein [Elusimicrobiota bacterium]MDE2313367.1 hypothetical protein [Elusimicrobiota bacterium]
MLTKRRTGQWSALAAACLLAWTAGPADAQDAGSGTGVSASSGVLQNVVVKGNEQQKPSLAKPPLKLKADPYAAIRKSLKPDDSLLLTDSPQIQGWSQARPGLLHSSGLIAPWNDALKQLPAIVIPARADLAATISQSGADRKGRGWSWSLDIVDEQGKAIRSFGDSGLPPDDLVWKGQSSDGSWIKAGHSYSLLYHWSNGTKILTAVGRTLEFPGIVHPNASGYSVSLDFSQLFENQGQSDSLADSGKTLLRAAADWFRRAAYGKGIAVSVSGADDAQAQTLQAELAADLSLSPNAITLQSAPSSGGGQSAVIRLGGS